MPAFLYLKEAGPGEGGWGGGAGGRRAIVATVELQPTPNHHNPTPAT